MALEDLPLILAVEDDHSVQSIVEEALSDGGFLLFTGRCNACG